MILNEYAYSDEIKTKKDEKNVHQSQYAQKKKFEAKAQIESRNQNEITWHKEAH